MNRYQLKMTNLDCEKCANELEEALRKIEEIEHVQINFLTQKLTFQCTEKNFHVALEKIRTTIQKELVKKIFKGQLL